MLKAILVEGDPAANLKRKKKFARTGESFASTNFDRRKALAACQSLVKEYMPSGVLSVDVWFMLEADGVAVSNNEQGFDS